MPVIFASSSTAKEWWLSPYGTTKKMTEVISDNYLQNVALRFSNVYGDGQRDTMLFSKMINNSLDFVSENHKMQITRPFDIINQPTAYDVKCSVSGGGHTGQAGAMVHGISKALVLFDENLKTTLKTQNLTTRDPRAVERKKPGRRKARRSFQFSKR